MKYMIEHFKNIQYLYGDDAYVQIPNDIFKNLSRNIKNRSGSTNIRQSSFAYVYLVCIGFLYKYAQFVDLNNGTYIKNTDIKQILGYSKSTKSIDHIIKKNGVLENMGLIKTTKNYPVSVVYGEDEYSNLKIREFITINNIDKDSIIYNKVKSVVKNKNYEIKEPTYMFEYNDNIGTLYDYSNTHKITINEFIKLIYDERFDNIDFMLYFFFKSRCYNLNKSNTKSMSLMQIINEIGISKDAFYTHLKIMKDNSILSVIHKEWVNGGEGESNEYSFIGI